MSTSSLRTLKPNVTREEAVRNFSAPFFSSLYWRMRGGPLQKIGEAFVPFWLYRVRYVLGSAPQTRLLAMDAVEGSLDLYEFPRIPADGELVALSSRNCLKPALLEETAEELLRDKVLRVIFQNGFFRLRAPKLEIMREPVEFCVPYWLGFYGGNGRVRCRVMDAVRRRIEGDKASAFFEQWLVSGPGNMCKISRP